LFNLSGTDLLICCCSNESCSISLHASLFSPRTSESWQGESCIAFLTVYCQL